MPRAIQIAAFGGPEQMQLVDVAVGEPGPGEIRIRHQACGLNFIDVYQRTGLYPNPLPLTLGMEGAGIVEAVGEGVTHLQVGRPRRLCQQPAGQLQRSARDAGQDAWCKLPDDIDFETGAAMMLKGLTAQYLLRRTLPVEGLQPGDFVLFHAAAGGVGPDRLPVGQGAGPAADRHRRRRRQVRAGAGARRRARDRLHQARTSSPGSRRSPAAGREGGLRLDRQGHLRAQPGLPAARSA